jgi:hypothetical protein
VPGAGLDGVPFPQVLAEYITGGDFETHDRSKVVPSERERQSVWQVNAQFLGYENFT